MQIWHVYTCRRGFDMELTEGCHRNIRLIQHYAKLVKPCLSYSGAVLEQWKPTLAVLRLVCGLGQCLEAWNTQRSSWKASQAQAAAQTFRRILECCEQILVLIDAGNIDETVLAFDYEYTRAVVTHHLLRDVIQTQRTEMLGGKTKEAACAAHMQAAQDAALAQRKRTLERLRSAARD